MDSLSPVTKHVSHLQATVPDYSNHNYLDVEFEVGQQPAHHPGLRSEPECTKSPTAVSPMRGILLQKRLEAEESEGVDFIEFCYDKLVLKNNRFVPRAEMENSAKKYKRREASNMSISLESNEESQYSTY